MRSKLYKAKLVFCFLLMSFGCSFYTNATNYYFVSQFSGSQEVPPNASPGQGVISGFYDDATNVLSYGIAFNNLTGNTTMGHFHAPAAPGANAGVVIGYAGFPLGVTSGIYTNTHVLTNAQETSLLAGLWYANIHSSAFPGGEIRSQLSLTALTAPVYTFISPYSGLQENPPNSSPAIGLIMGIYNPATNQLDYGLGFANLTAPTSASHFHAPAPPGMNGPVIYPHGVTLGITSGTKINSHIITEAQEGSLLAGLWYSNIHSTAFPGGELRAQIIIKPTFLNTLSIVGDATCGINDGQISIIPTSGIPPFMYSLDGGATYNPGPDVGFTKFNLPAGMYSLRLKDANGIESEIVQRQIKSINCPCTPPTFLNTLPIIGNATCGQNDGQIVLIPTSGTPPFMYSINGGSTYTPGPNVGVTFFNMAAGTYQLRIKDATGCESAVVVRTVATINCPTCTPPTFLNTPPIIGDATCNNNDGQIVLIPTSGTGPFMYSIDGGTTYVAGPDAGYTFFNVAPGTYQLRIKAGACESAVVTKTVKKVNIGPASLEGTPVTGSLRFSGNPTNYFNSSNGFVPAGYGNSGLGSTTLNISNATTEFGFLDGANRDVAEFNGNTLTITDMALSSSTNAPFTMTFQLAPGLVTGVSETSDNFANGGLSFSLVNDLLTISAPGFAGAGTYTAVYTFTTAGCAARGVVASRPSTKTATPATLPTYARSTPSMVEETISTYPNPSRGKFKLLVQHFDSPKAEVSIFDSKGAMVQKSIMNLSKSTSMDVNLSGKAPGIYSVKVVTNNGTTTSKVVIQ